MESEVEPASRSFRGFRVGNLLVGVLGGGEEVGVVVFEDRDGVDTESGFGESGWGGRGHGNESFGGL